MDCNDANLYFMIHKVENDFAGHGYLNKRRSE